MSAPGSFKPRWKASDTPTPKPGAPSPAVPEPKPELAFTRELAFRVLVELIEEHGLRVVRHRGGGVWPDYGPQFSPADVAFIQDIFLSASPIPHEEIVFLAVIQAKADRRAKA